MAIKISQFDSLIIISSNLIVYFKINFNFYLVIESHVMEIIGFYVRLLVIVAVNNGLNKNFIDGFCYWVDNDVPTVNESLFIRVEV